MFPSITCRFLPKFLLLSLTAFGAASCSTKEAEVVKTAEGLYAYVPAKAVHKSFSGKQAMEYVKAQLDIGPRPSGSEAAERCRQFIEKTLKGFGWEVQRQTFKSYTPKGNIEFSNIRARFPMQGSDTWKRYPGLLLGSHYDTKMFSFPFVGANDGASSTGALLEMGRVTSQRPELAQFLELVFFDGEEAVVDFKMDPSGKLPEDGLYGSRHYVDELKKGDKQAYPLAMILMDMIGEKDVRIEMPTGCSPGLMAGIMAASRELGTEQHFNKRGGGILDDHTPFMVAGIPVVDIIDLDYKVWHTQGDTIEQLAPESLEIVGQTTLLAIEKTFLGQKVWE